MSDLEGLRFETNNRLEDIQKQKIEIERKILELSSRKITIFNVFKILNELKNLLITLGCIETYNLSNLEIINKNQLDLMNIMCLFQQQIDILNGKG